MDETEVSMWSESVDEEANVCAELVGSDDVEITMDETVERAEVDHEVTADKLDETDGTLILTEDDIRISSDSGGSSISHNVKKLVARFEKYPTESRSRAIATIQISHQLELVRLSTIRFYIIDGPIV
jgi:hypothetical protein